ncbi:MAG: hypothetical protein U1F27_08955 [Turneriella sp.]
MQGSFTLSYHYFTPKDSRNHLELFLDIDGESLLETWRCFENPGQNKTRQARRFSSAPPHRRIYLEFAGKIAGNRGKLRILRRGKFIDYRARKPEVRTAHEVHPRANRRTRMSEVCAVQEVQLGADDRARKPENCYIKVTL